MRHPKDIIVSTTDRIDGQEILQYLKPISAHVVTGTGFLVILLHPLVMFLVVVQILTRNSCQVFTMRL